MITLALQARGATLEWPLRDDVLPHLTVHDPAEADWLHLLIGEAAHVGLLRGEDHAPAWNRPLAARLRRLAFGHWLRAWWPTSVLDGVPPLDRTLLDAELALLTDDLDEIMAFSPDGEIPLDEEALRTLHHPLAARALELLGIAAPAPTAPTREDYALVAGDRLTPGATAVLSGTSPHAWAAVPAGRIDASEHAVAWVLEVTDHPELSVAVQLLPGAQVAGIAVRATAGPAQAAGVLDAAGTAQLSLPLEPAAAWSLTVADVDVRIGVDVAEDGEERASVRTLVAQRRTGTPDHNGPLYQAERELIIDDW